MRDALCQEYDRELFFPGRGASSEEARGLCGRCLVQRECREYALADDTLVGVWGGTSASERDQLRKRTALDEVA
jgi:WhiB family transcriptional regulator, redox-sensing transcriptional regulator